LSPQSFMWIAFGVAALVVALALAALLIRVRGTLGAVEELLDTTNEELKETLPEVRQTIGNVNDITAGVNVGLRTAGGGAAARRRGGRGGGSRREGGGSKPCSHRVRRLEMADERDGGGGGFGWFILGGLIGLAAGAYIASGPGRSQGDSLRSKTIELSGSEPVQRAKDAAQRARQMVSDPDHPVGKAIQDGVAAAKRKRDELEASAMRKMQQPADGKE